jgi:hypothetical protein
MLNTLAKILSIMHTPEPELELGASQQLISVAAIHSQWYPPRG